MARLFLCDDSSEYRALVREILGPEDDLDVVGEACDAQECLDSLPKAGADVLLLDVKMPGMSGLEVLPELRRRAPDVPIVVLSSASAEAAGKAALEQGATAFVQKPMRASALADAIREAIADLDDAA
jgi:DNA-binding NarL/FixJ family response regulator